MAVAISSATGVHSQKIGLPGVCGMRGACHSALTTVVTQLLYGWAESIKSISTKWFRDPNLGLLGSSMQGNRGIFQTCQIALCMWPPYYRGRKNSIHHAAKQIFDT